MAPLSTRIAGDLDQPYPIIEVMTGDRLIFSVLTDEQRRPQVVTEMVRAGETLPIGIVADILQRAMHEWLSLVVSTDHARLHSARAVDTERDWLGSELRTFDELTAFDAMRAFLQARTQAGEVSAADLVMDLDRSAWKSGMPVNPETWSEWRRSVDVALGKG